MREIDVGGGAVACRGRASGTSPERERRVSLVIPFLVAALRLRRFPQVAAPRCARRSPFAHRSVLFEQGWGQCSPSTLIPSKGRSPLLMHGKSRRITKRVRTHG